MPNLSRKIGMISALGLLLLTACGPDISKGVVANKEYEPARSWVQAVPMTVMAGKVPITTMVVTNHYDDEDYVLWVRGKTSEGTSVMVRFYVANQEEWSDIHIGDQFLDGKVNGLQLSHTDVIEKRRKN